MTSLLPFLSDRGHDITLMLRRRGGEFEKYIPQNITIKDFPYKPSRFSDLLYSLRLRLRPNTHPAEIYWQTIGKRLPSIKEEYDVAIAYQQGFPSFYVAEKVNADKKIAWINTDLDKANYSIDFNKRIYDKFTHIVPVTDILCNIIQEKGYVRDSKKISVINDIINESVIKSLAKEKVDIAGTPEIRLATVGRLVEAKGYDLAIKAASLLKEKNIHFTWHFIGEGPLHAELKKMVKDKGLEENIIFEGFRSNPYPFIKAADVYVQTSKFEGLCITIGEAKILGKAIVSTDFPVVHNQLSHETNGIICEMKGEAIAESIIRLIDDSELRSKLERNVGMESNNSAKTESEKAIRLIEGK